MFIRCSGLIAEIIAHTQTRVRVSANLDMSVRLIGRMIFPHKGDQTNMKIQINYQEIADIAYRTAELASGVTPLTGRLQAQHETVRETWLGDGSVKYCAEMDERMLPAMRRLSDRLLQLNEGLRRVTAEFADAEERAAAP